MLLQHILPECLHWFTRYLLNDLFFLQKVSVRTSKEESCTWVLFCNKGRKCYTLEVSKFFYCKDLLMQRLYSIFCPSYIGHTFPLGNQKTLLWQLQQLLICNFRKALNVLNSVLMQFANENKEDKIIQLFGSLETTKKFSTDYWWVMGKSGNHCSWEQ